jgi:hypothetical protein
MNEEHASADAGKTQQWQEHVTHIHHYTKWPKRYFESGWSSTLWHRTKEDPGIKKTKVLWKERVTVVCYIADGSKQWQSDSCVFDCWWQQTVTEWQLFVWLLMAANSNRVIVVCLIVDGSKQ